MHRRPELYPDPLAFRPERFLEQPGGTYTLVPFGGGRRRCLGASFALFELRTILRVVLRAHELRAPTREPEPVKWRGLGLAPARGGQIVLEPRQPSATARPPQSAAA
jgi:cytochrome P450